MAKSKKKYHQIALYGIIIGIIIWSIEGALELWLN